MVGASIWISVSPQHHIRWWSLPSLAPGSADNTLTSQTLNCYFLHLLFLWGSLSSQHTPDPDFLLATSHSWFMLSSTCRGFSSFPSGMQLLNLVPFPHLQLEPPVTEPNSSFFIFQFKKKSANFSQSSWMISNNFQILLAHRPLMFFHFSSNGEESHSQVRLSSTSWKI